MTRVTDDETLKDGFGGPGPKMIVNPLLIVDQVNGKQQYIVVIEALDRLAAEPTMFGIILSDLVDHIAAAYNRVGGHDEAMVREHLMRTIRREDKFKDQDPKRGRQRGATIMPGKVN